MVCPVYPDLCARQQGHLRQGNFLTVQRSPEPGQPSVTLASDSPHNPLHLWKVQCGNTSVTEHSMDPHHHQQIQRTALHLLSCSSLDRHFCNYQIKLTDLGLNSHLCNWILDFLTSRTPGDEYWEQLLFHTDSEHRGYSGMCIILPLKNCSDMIREGGVDE